MHRCSDSIGALAGALAKAPIWPRNQLVAQCRNRCGQYRPRAVGRDSSAPNFREPIWSELSGFCCDDDEGLRWLGPTAENS